MGFPSLKSPLFRRRQSSFSVYKHSPLPLKGRHLTTTLMFPPPPIGAAPGAMVSRGSSAGIVERRRTLYISQLSTQEAKELSKGVRDSNWVGFPKQSILFGRGYSFRTSQHVFPRSGRTGTSLILPCAEGCCRSVEASSVSRQWSRCCRWLAAVLCRVVLPRLPVAWSTVIAAGERMTAHGEEGLLWRYNGAVGV